VEFSSCSESLEGLSRHEEREEASAPTAANSFDKSVTVDVEESIEGAMDESKKRRLSSEGSPLTLRNNQNK
jgi:hypothetical protein